MLARVVHEVLTATRQRRGLETTVAFAAPFPRASASAPGLALGERNVAHVPELSAEADAEVLVDQDGDVRPLPVQDLQLLSR